MARLRHPGGQVECQIDRWEGQDNVTQVDKGGGTMHLLSRVNEFSEGEDNIKRLTVSLEGPLS